MDNKKVEEFGKKYDDLMIKLRKKDAEKYSRVAMYEPEKRTENEQKMNDQMTAIVKNHNEMKNLKSDHADDILKDSERRYKILLELAEKEFGITL